MTTGRINQVSVNVVRLGRANTSITFSRQLSQYTGPYLADRPIPMYQFPNRRPKTNTIRWSGAEGGTQRLGDLTATWALAH